MTADIASGVALNGFQVHLLVGITGSDFFIHYLDGNNIPYSLVPQQILSKKLSTIIRYLLSFISDIVVIVRAIKKIRPDLIYCNGSQQIKGVIAATLTGRKVIWHMHDTYQPLPILFVFRLIRFLCRVKWFVASSERTIAFYGLNIKNTLISRPPIDTSHFKHSPPTPILTPERPVKVLTIANVNSDKGLDTLIRVAAEINKIGGIFTFTIVGLGAEHRNRTYLRLLQLVELLGVGNVKFVGQKSHIYSILSDVDFYLCTSRNESGPISVFEALAMRVPVISTDVGDLSHLFSRYNYGKVLAVGDHIGIANELVNHTTNRELLQHKATTGRIIAERELDISICTTKQVDFYHRVSSIQLE